MNNEGFYCSDCRTRHEPPIQGQRCEVCGHTVCAAKYAANHQPQDLHQVLSVLESAIEHAREGQANISEWLEYEMVPLGQPAQAFLKRAEAVLAQSAEALQVLQREVEKARSAVPQR